MANQSGTGILAGPTPEQKLEQERIAADRKAEEAQKAADKQKAADEKSKHSNLSAQEKAERDKVNRERDIMRDPHEHDAEKAKVGGAHPMPMYHDNDGKTVSALRIKEIKELVPPDEKNRYELHFVEAGYGPVRVSAPWVTANLPRPGSWYLADSGGTRVMDAQAFLAKYQSKG